MIRRLIGLIIITIWLTGCATNSTTTYYALDEKGQAIIEINPLTAQVERTISLTLPDLDNKGPEGLAFVSNQNVSQYGLFGLELATHGGYFLVSVQKKGRIFIFDVPLKGQPPETTAPSLTLEIPGLERDASELYYNIGQLWVVAAKDEKLYQVSTTNQPVKVLAIYDLSRLPFHDLEGLTLQQNTAYLADDTAKMVSKYDNFPACLTTQSCTPSWQYDFSPSEPSGLAWDTPRQQLLMADDRGHLFSLSPDGTTVTDLVTTAYNLEAVVILSQ